MQLTALQLPFDFRNLMECLSAGIISLSRSTSCAANCAADASFCNCTRMFLLSFNVFPFLHRGDDFRHALSSCAIVERSMAGSV